MVKMVKVKDKGSGLQQFPPVRGLLIEAMMYLVPFLALFLTLNPSFPPGAEFMLPLAFLGAISLGSIINIPSILWCYRLYKRQQAQLNTSHLILQTVVDVSVLFITSIGGVSSSSLVLLLSGILYVSVSAGLRIASYAGLSILLKARQDTIIWERTRPPSTTLPVYNVSTSSR
ncbi:MAG: hypothetical protein ACFE89_02165 [Candidatus Hodarchaeota archaeon]